MMKKFFIILQLFLFAQIAVFSQIRDLLRTTPESMGIPSTKILEYFDSLMRFPNTEIHSVIIMRHGRIVSEIYPKPFMPQYGHTLFSCSKTFTAAAIGIAINERLLKLDDRVVSFFPEHLPYPVSAQLQRITIEDLLTMRSGFVVDTKMRTISKQWIKDYLAHAMNAEPGTRFAYDSIDTYLLSAILQKVTGKTLLQYLKEHIFNNLHITEVKWEYSPEGITTGGWGLYLQPESMAKFGQLLLQKGKWKGKQLIPANWVTQMMQKHVTNKQGDDYCYQMWRCGNHDAARADGAYGQFIYVLPGKDMVITVTQCMTSGNANQHNMIWKMLVPYISNQILEENHGTKELRKFESEIKHPLPEGKKIHHHLDSILGRTIALTKNPLEWNALQLSKDNENNLHLIITDSKKRKADILLGFKEWKTSPIGIYPPYVRTATQNRFSSFYPPFLAGAAYAWDDDMLKIKIHFVDWLSSVELRIKFDQGKIALSAKENYQAKSITIGATLR